MSFITTVTPKELERQAAAVFEGKAYEVFLAINPGALGPDSTTAEWKAQETPVGGGYAPLTGTVGVGSYDAVDGRYELPQISASWVGADAGFTYDTLVLVIDNAAYPHSVSARVGDNETILDGQPLNVAIDLRQDDA